MKQVPFTKMQAQGNDFVILSGLKDKLPEITEDFVRHITERRYGIGCDQLLVLERDKGADARMRIFNNDGSKAANCGNGLRCAGDLLLRQLRKKAVTIALADRCVHTERSEHGIRVEMGSARIEERTGAHVDVDVGNLHRVFFEMTEDIPPERNVEIITGQIADHVYVDIIERGAGRTQACGSGACAVAAAIWHVEDHTRPLTIEMPGGEVIVSGSHENLILEGGVTTVYTGKYLLPPGG